MSEVVTQKCDGDGCSKFRVNDANHWMIGWVKNRIVHITLMNGPKIGDDVPFVESPKHFCGQQCATRWILMEMDKLK